MFDFIDPDLVEMTGYHAEHRIDLFQERLSEFQAIPNYSKILLYFYYTLELHFHSRTPFNKDAGLAAIRKLDELYEQMSKEEQQFITKRHTTSEMKLLPLNLSVLGYFYTKSIEVAFIFGLIMRKMLVDRQIILQYYDHFMHVYSLIKEQNDKISMTEYLIGLLIFIELVDPFNPRLPQLYDELLESSAHHSLSFNFAATDTYFKTSHFVLTDEQYNKILFNYNKADEYYENFNLIIAKELAIPLVRMRKGSFEEFYNVVETISQNITGQLPFRLLSSPMYTLARFRVGLFLYGLLPLYASHKSTAAARSVLQEFQQLIIPNTNYYEELTISYTHLSILLDIAEKGILAIDYKAALESIMKDIFSRSSNELFHVYRIVDFIHFVSLLLSADLINNSLQQILLDAIDKLSHTTQSYPFITLKLNILKLFVEDSCLDLLNPATWQNDFLLPYYLYFYKNIDIHCDFSAAISTHLNIFAIGLPELLVKLLDRDILNQPHYFFSYGIL